MKTVRYTAILIILANIFVLCTKNDNEPEPYFFRAGIKDCPNCVYYNFDTLEIFGGYNTPESKMLDIDLDGENDLIIECSFSGSPGGLSISGSSITSLKPEVQIAYETKNDSLVNYTIRTAVDTTIQPPPGFDSTIMSYTFSYNDSLELPENYTLNISEENYCFPLNYNDPVDASLNWLSDTLQLVYQNATQTYYVNGPLYGYIFGINLGIWKINEEKFLGIKIEDKYGWIRMKIESYSKVIIFESLVGEPDCGCEK